MDGFDWVVGEITALTYIVTLECCLFSAWFLLIELVTVLHSPSFS